MAHKIPIAHEMDLPTYELDEDVIEKKEGTATFNTD